MAESELPPLKAMDESNADEHDASKETYRSFKYALPFSMPRRQEQFLRRHTTHIELISIMIYVIALALG